MRFLYGLATGLAVGALAGLVIALWYNGEYTSVKRAESKS
jgi:gas vesicle protein